MDVVNDSLTLSRSFESPKVAIIVLNWNGAFDTIECVNSLIDMDYDNYTIVLVDNASTDDSVELIRGYINGLSATSSEEPSNADRSNRSGPLIARDGLDSCFVEEYRHGRIFFIRCEVNTGFGGGNNSGISFSLRELCPDFVMLLNNDTVVERDCLRTLVEVAMENSPCLVSPTIFEYSHPNVVQHGGQRVRTLFTTYSCDSEGDKLRRFVEADSVAGPCVMAPAALFSEIGPIPERYSYLFGDLWISAVAHKIGYKILSVRAARMFHKGSVSLSKTSRKTLEATVREGIIFRREFWSVSRFLVRMAVNIVLYYPYAALKWMFMFHNLNGFRSILSGFYDGFYRYR